MGSLLPVFVHGFYERLRDMSIEVSLAGKVAIVTGGRRQLGAAQAKRLAECGADVCIADIADDDHPSWTTQWEASRSAGKAQRASLLN